MTESDYIIQHLRMDMDKLRKEKDELMEHNLTIMGTNKMLMDDNRRFMKDNTVLMDIIFAKTVQISALEEALKEEWDVEEICYCTRCGRPMPEPAWSDEANEYCDICAGDMGVI